ncbi:MAG TPA: hypothetical protein VN445_09335 [Rectinemataceae bacterium]|nr:hypothetical protein [Rectinemataceae bacterium]
MEDSVEAFWTDFEKETGEKVLAKTMGQLFSSPKDRGDWGLIVLSPRGIRFRRTPGENWFASMFRNSSPPVPAKSEEDLVIPYDSISAIKNPPKKFLDFLFGSPFLLMVISYEKDGQGREARFAVDPRSDFQKQLKGFVEG